MELRENSIYALPDGREFVARAGTHGGHFLHNTSRGDTSAPVYLVDRSGQLLSWGRITRWSLKDLRDTGRISLRPMQRLQVV